MASEITMYILLSHNTSNNIKKITFFFFFLLADTEFKCNQVRYYVRDSAHVFSFLSDSGILGTFMHQGVVLD